MCNLNKNDRGCSKFSFYLLCYLYCYIKMNSNLEIHLNENVRQVNWAYLSEEELVLSDFIEGVPPESFTQISSPKTILVSISSEEIETHLGRVKTSPF